MPRGKSKESDKLKTAFEMYLKLDEIDRQEFATKMFRSMMYGMDDETRTRLKAMKKKLMDEIKEAQELKTLEKRMESIPTEVLEKVLELRKVTEVIQKEK